MFKAVRDIAVGDVIIQAGEVVENPTTRMIDLGLVVEVQDEPKKEKAEKVEKKEKAEKVEKVEEKEAEAPKEEILTEQSSNVTVEKTEE